MLIEYAKNYKAVYAIALPAIKEGKEIPYIVTTFSVRDMELEDVIKLYNFIISNNIRTNKDIGGVYNYILSKLSDIPIKSNSYGFSWPDYKQYIKCAKAFRDIVCTKTKATFIKKKQEDADFFSAGSVYEEISYTEYDNPHDVVITLPDKYYRKVFIEIRYRNGWVSKSIVEQVKGLKFTCKGETHDYKECRVIEQNKHNVLMKRQKMDISNIDNIKATFFGIDPKILKEVDPETGLTVEEWYLRHPKMWAIRLLSYDYIINNMFVFSEKVQIIIKDSAEIMLKQGIIPKSLENFGDVDYLENEIYRSENKTKDKRIRDYDNYDYTEENEEDEG